MSTGKIANTRVKTKTAAITKPVSKVRFDVEQYLVCLAVCPLVHRQNITVHSTVSRLTYQLLLEKEFHSGTGHQRTVEIQSPDEMLDTAILENNSLVKWVAFFFMSSLAVLHFTVLCVKELF